MLKFTLDALSKVVYEDDDQVRQVFGAKVDLAIETVELPNVSPLLARALDAALREQGPFMYLRVSEPLSLEEFLL